MYDRLSKVVICLILAPVLFLVACIVVCLIPVLPIVALIRPDLIKIKESNK